MLEKLSTSYRWENSVSSSDLCCFSNPKPALATYQRKILPFEIPSSALLFPVEEGKANATTSIIFDETLRRYAGQKEVRFKVTDKKMEIYRETASYLYEYNLMEKPNLQSFGRWCMDRVCKEYGQSVIESRIMKQREQRQKQMQQSHSLSYPPYYTSDPTQPFL